MWRAPVFNRRYFEAPMMPATERFHCIITIIIIISLLTMLQLK